MNSDEPFQQNIEPSRSRREIELAIVNLLNRACARLQAPEARHHNDLLTRFQDQIQLGDTSQLEELNRWISPLLIYDTPEDDYNWQESDIAVQLAQHADDSFVVSAWSKELLKLIGEHSTSK